MSEGLFADNSKATLKKVITTITERAKQYGDSFGVTRYLTLKAVLKGFPSVDNLTDEQCHAIAAAVLCDIKYHRQQGGYREDTTLDLIAYQSFLNEQMSKIKNTTPPEK